jgi:hypothetical protein
VLLPSDVKRCSSPKPFPPNSCQSSTSTPALLVRPWLLLAPNEEEKKKSSPRFVFSTNSSLDATVLPFKVFRQITHRQSGQTTGLHKGKKIAYRQVPAACKLPWNNPSRSFSHRQRENTLTEIGEAKAASSGNPAPEKHALSCAAITIPAKPCAGRTTPTYRRNPAAFAH